MEIFSSVILALNFLDIVLLNVTLVADFLNFDILCTVCKVFAF